VANDETPPFRPQLPTVNTQDHQRLDWLLDHRLTTGWTCSGHVVTTSVSWVLLRTAGFRTRARDQTLLQSAPDSPRSTKESMLHSSTNIVTLAFFNLRQRGYGLPRVCLYVRLFVCWQLHTVNCWSDLSESFARDVSEDKEELTTLWKSSASGSGLQKWVLKIQVFRFLQYN